MTPQDVNEAIRRLPQEEVDLRLQRLKRASDVSLKKSYLPKDVQAQQTPFNFYLKVCLHSSTQLFLQLFRGAIALYLTNCAEQGGHSTSHLSYAVLMTRVPII